MKAPQPRAQGFVGEHLVVLPPPVVAVAARDPLLAGVLPTDAGSFPRVPGHRVVRAQGLAAHILIACTAGTGWVRARGQMLEVRAPALVWIPPDEPHAYGADAEDPWSLEWVHAIGSELPLWRGRILADPLRWVQPLPRPLVEGLGFERVCTLLAEGYGEAQLLEACAQVRQSLARLVRLRGLAENAPTVDEAVEATARWMQANLRRRVSLADLAARARLSPSHYGSRFRRRYGHAPIDWLLRQRILQACRLLETSRDKVEAIGAAVGFEDPYYFSRVFRQVMGHSPRAHRRKSPSG